MILLLLNFILASKYLSAKTRSLSFFLLFFIWRHCIHSISLYVFNNFSTSILSLSIIEIFEILAHFWEQETQGCNIFIIFVTNKILFSTRKLYFGYKPLYSIKILITFYNIKKYQTRIFIHHYKENNCLSVYV